MNHLAPKGVIPVRHTGCAHRIRDEDRSIDCRACCVKMCKRVLTIFFVISSCRVIACDICFQDRVLIVSASRRPIALSDTEGANNGESREARVGYSGGRQTNPGWKQKDWPWTIAAFHPKSSTVPWRRKSRLLPYWTPQTCCFSISGFLIRFFACLAIRKGGSLITCTYQEAADGLIDSLDVG